MSEFLSSCIKGTYPYFSLVILAAVIYLLKTRQWKKEYTLLIALYFTGVFLVIGQILIGDRIIFVSRRYLLPFVPVLFGFAAWGWENVSRRFSSGKGKKIFLAVTVLAAVSLYYDAFAPTLKDYFSSRRICQRREVGEMTKIIKADLLSLKPFAEPDIWWFEPRFAGTCIIKDAPAELVYQIGGRFWTEYFPAEKYHYVTVPSSRKISEDGLKMIYSGKIFKLYKRAEK